jgi:transcriptional regulator with XRE-family HTH domain
MALQNSISERSETICKLLEDKSARESYVRATLNVLIPSQIRSLRLREPWTQQQLGKEADMKQARVSASESPGAVNFSLETLIRFAAAFRVGLQVRFVPFSEMLDWENKYSQDDFAETITKIEDDSSFLKPETLKAARVLNMGEQKALNPHQEKTEMINPLGTAVFNGDKYAGNVDSSSTGVGVHGAWGVEPWWQGVSAGSSESVDGAVSIPRQQQYQLGRP